MADKAAYRGLFAYTWDLADEEPDAFADEVSRLSLNTLTIAASYHARKIMRPHGASEKVYFPEDGIAHCRVRPERYGAIKPDTGALALEKDIFGAYAARTDPSVNAWLVLLHNSRLGFRHPDAVARNAFGDPYYYSLCPSAPQAREYAVALCADIAGRYPVKGLSLETPGWLPFRHGYHHEFALLGSMPGIELRLGLCFCTHCTRLAGAAGIDMEGLAARTRQRISAALEASSDPVPSIDRTWFEADLLLDPDLSALLKWRCGVVTSLIAEIRAAVRADASVHVIPSVNQPLALSWAEGSDLAALEGDGDGLEICLYGGSQQSALSDYREVAGRAGKRQIRCILRPAPPDYPEEGGFAATIAALAREGVRDFSFYNFGHVRKANLEWIGRALQAIDSNGARV